MTQSITTEGGVRAQVLGVGIIGAGQLARMTVEAASALDIPIAVLAEQSQDSAAKIASQVLIGAPVDVGQLWALAARSEVLTFDHELVDLQLLSSMEESGVILRPPVRALQAAVDKSIMREVLTKADIAVPAYAVLGNPTSPSTVQQIEDFATNHGWPIVLKAVRGGYDGKGVWVVASRDEAVAVCQRSAASGTPLMAEEEVRIQTELAVLMARRPSGEMVVWNPVETIQANGVCQETLMPGTLGPQLAEEARLLARKVAEAIDVTGVLAVEMFWSGSSLLVNEVATRPHNTGHWTIEGAVTSQFENHLRAILDLPLGDTDPVADHVATVNVFGGADGIDPSLGLPEALAVGGAHVHLYSKRPSPGRKLGHVTVCGTDPSDVRHRAWKAARALGTPQPEVTNVKSGVL